MASLKKNQLAPSLQYHADDPENGLVFSGHWVMLTLDDGLMVFENYQSRLLNLKGLTIRFDANFIHDSAGAWIIAKFLKNFNLSSDEKKSLPEIISNFMDKSFEFPKEECDISFDAFLSDIGRSATQIGKNFYDSVEFFGQSIVHIYETILYKYGFKWATASYFIEAVGLKAIPIISLISLLIGAVLAYQGVTQLERFGASSYAVDFLAISLLREISVLLTSIVVAGRSGSAFTAQIGTMALNEEIDAIRMMGINPFHVLIIPRIIALLISLPVLVLISMLCGGIGGMIVVRGYTGMPYGAFWNSFQAAASHTTFWTGMSKAPLFALIIAVIGCYRGMQVKGSAESVGIMTTRSVVESIFMVIICDAVMSIFFTAMDW